MLDRLLEWDRNTFVYLNSLGVEEYDVFWSTVTNIKTWIPLFIFFFVMIAVKYGKREAPFVIITVISLVFFIVGLTDITKNAVTRLRPNNTEDINTIIRILKSPTTYSFFSGHASSSFAITTLIVLFLRKRFKWCWLFYVWPLLFVTSRIYVGVHYPVDIIVGALVGVASAFLFYNLYTKFIAPYIASSHP